MHFNPQRIENKSIHVNTPLSIPVADGPLHIVAEMEKGEANQFDLSILGYEIMYDDLLGVFSTSETPGTGFEYVKPGTEIFSIEAVADKNILEVFISLCKKLRP